jgi:hypothetical protein
VSNPYLIQMERGCRALGSGVTSIAQALNLSSEALFAQAALMPESTEPDDDATKTALRVNSRTHRAASGRCVPKLSRSDGHGLMDNAADGLTSPTR